jgi:hypothetical protein
MTNIDSTSAVFKDTIMAYRSARQAGEMDHLAFMAAMQAYDDHQPGNSEAGRVVGQMIYIATERATEWFWKGAR